LVEILDDVFVVTREGYEEIQRELNEIITVKRPEVIQTIREARQLGDPTESFDYEDAKRVQAMLEVRVKELKAILAHATVIERAAPNGCVDIGSRVVVKSLDDGLQEEYTIVGPAESSPSDGRISHESCVGRELMGKRAGDQVRVEVPSGVIRYEVISVR
jgi:transcription elongation factor GreA